MTITTVTIGEACYRHRPCKHDVTIVFANGAKKKRRLESPDIDVLIKGIAKEKLINNHPHPNHFDVPEGIFEPVSLEKVLGHFF